MRHNLTSRADDQLRVGSPGDAFGRAQNVLLLIWAKPKMGLGDWLRGQTEHCYREAEETGRVQIMVGGSIMASRRFVVAVVDDDPDVSQAIKRVLKAFGYRIELFASAEEFINAAMTTEATCLLVDIQLGGISGVELGRHLSAIGFDFPIIFMTGSQDERIRHQAIDFGCIAYLHKPFEAEQLIAAIKSAIGHNPDVEKRTPIQITDGDARREEG
jgi:CheY-like chemotaxis protein